MMSVVVVECCCCCLLQVGNLKNCVDVYLLSLLPICVYIYWRDLRVFTF